MPLIRGIRATGLGGTTRNGLEQIRYVYKGRKPLGSDAPPMSILARGCPTCHAPPGCRCKRADGGWAHSFHKTRRTGETP